MPPRFAYWTILIDNKPTAFRAQKQEDLLPTFKQLSRANPNIVMKWFARGRLWESPEQARWAQAHAVKPRDRRGPDWRPGGPHRDPRAKFERSKAKRPSAAPKKFGDVPERESRPLKSVNRSDQSSRRPPGARRPPRRRQ